MTAPAPSPRTAYEWTRHDCRFHIDAVMAYISQHPRGMKK